MAFQSAAPTCLFGGDIQICPRWKSHHFLWRPAGTGTYRFHGTARLTTPIATRYFPRSDDYGLGL